MEWNRSKRTSSFSVGSFNKPIHLNDYDRYTHPIQQQAIQPLQSHLPVRSAYYESHWPLFCSDWKSSNVSPNNDLVALSTFKEDSSNRIEIISGTPSLVEHANGLTSTGVDFFKVSESNVDLPVTKLQWDPSNTESHVERLISSSDRLKIWELDYDSRLIERANLINGSALGHTPSGLSRPQSLPPLTSFDWNKVSPNLVITSSIDTTCTLWDLNSVSSPKTQLIAHDSEVLDVQFIKGSPDIFASVGSDGSLRLFDLRALQHSTIIYEPSTNLSSALSLQNAYSSPGKGNSGDTQPLLRLDTSNTDSNIIATFAAKSDTINVLDLRNPGQPTTILAGHSSTVNSIKWHPTLPKLLSGGDDCQALIWNFGNGNTLAGNHQGQGRGHTNVEYPGFAYSDTLEINNVTWSRKGDWFGVVSGKGFQGIKS